MTSFPRCTYYVFLLQFGVNISLAYRIFIYHLIIPDRVKITLYKNEVVDLGFTFDSKLLSFCSHIKNMSCKPVTLSSVFALILSYLPLLSLFIVLLFVLFWSMVLLSGFNHYC